MHVHKNISQCSIIFDSAHAHSTQYRPVRWGGSVSQKVITIIICNGHNTDQVKTVQNLSQSTYTLNGVCTLYMHQTPRYNFALCALTKSPSFFLFNLGETLYLYKHNLTCVYCSHLIISLSIVTYLVRKDIGGQRYPILRHLV